MSTVFLHPIRKTFYRRVQIPKKIRQHFKGRVEVWRSLRTSDKDEATLRASQFDALTSRLFLTLKRHGERMKVEQIEALVHHWLESELDYAEDCRVLAGPMSDDDRESQLEGLSIMFDETHEALLGNNYRKIEKEADELLRAAGLPPLDHDGADFGRLCRRLLLAKQEYTRIEADRWNGVYENLHQNHSAHCPAVVSSTNPNAAATPKGLMFNEASKAYFKENARAERTDAQVKALSV